MTGSDGVLMGRAELEQAFTRLGERLVRRGVVADIFVVGGAAVFVPHGVVLDEARAVADDRGLPPWWLNEQASVYVSGKGDPGKRRVVDHPGLRVMAASSEHVFAMEALAARARDVDDRRGLGRAGRGRDGGRRRTPVQRLLSRRGDLTSGHGESSANSSNKPVAG